MANITKVYLLSVPLENDYKDTLYFANATAQHNYFAGQVVKSYTDFSYQRKDSVIRVPAIVDSIRNCNYVMYQNSAYSNKWFYAFIERMVYVDDGRTDIYISTDVLQTWMFDMVFKDSFIEREHVNDDTFGIHTIPESLETGEFVCNDIVEQKYGVNDWTQPGMMVIFQVSDLDLSVNGQNNKPSNPPTYNTTNGIPNGCYYIGVDYIQANLPAVNAIIGAYDGAGKSDAIISIFLCPKNLVSWHQTEGENSSGFWHSIRPYAFFTDDSGGAFQFGQAQVPLNSSLDGYVPHNNKCFTSPFNYIYASNNAGQDVQFRYEDFRGTPVFTTRGVLEQGGCVKCTPDNSKASSYWNGVINKGEGWNEGLSGGKFPQLGWKSDFYLNWEAINGRNVEIQAGLSAINFAGNMITGMVGGAMGASQATTSAWNSIYYDTNPNTTERKLAEFNSRSSGAGNYGGNAIGAVANFASDIANTMQQVKQAKMTPDQAKGNMAGGYMQFASGMCKFTFRKMSVRYEFAKCIDSWFDMFGYKVNRLGKPLKNHRQNYWYTKTIGANIDGNIPNEDMQIIKSIYNNGVTYWKDATKIKDYSVSNNIV